MYWLKIDIFISHFKLIPPLRLILFELAIFTQHQSERWTDRQANKLDILRPNSLHYTKHQMVKIYSRNNEMKAIIYNTDTPAICSNNHLYRHTLKLLNQYKVSVCING